MTELMVPTILKHVLMIWELSNTGVNSKSHARAFRPFSAHSPVKKAL